MLYESGTYASTSGNGVWVGHVQDNQIDDKEGKMEHRYLGTLSRNFNAMDLGPRDVTGKISYHPQDMRLVFIGTGSIVDTSGTNYLHVVSPINTNVQQSAFTSGPLNPPMSFTLEDSKQSPGTGRNFIRTINGVVPNTTTLTLKQKDRASVEIDYVGQTLTYTSGNTTTLTENTSKPYLWNSATLQMNGSPIQTAKEIVLKIKQNVEAPHYLNGSRNIAVPFMKDREIDLDVTLDLHGNDAQMLYETFYKNNGSFNGVVDLNQDNATTGSQHAIFTLSGCYIMSMDNPSKLNGVNESKLNISVQNVYGTEWTGSSTGYYLGPFNPW